MGTWDDGLYDNDGALDVLGDLVTLPEVDAAPAQLAVGIGLVAWLNPVPLELRGEAHVAAALACGEALPPAAREVLAALARDPAEVLRGRSRSEEARAALGGYCDGPRLDALLRVPGGPPTIDALGEQAGEVLDGMRGEGLDLYDIQAGLGALGIVVELAEAGLWSPVEEREAEWRVAFVRADMATRSEREFWDGYAARVRLAFDHLARVRAPAR